MTVKKQTKHNTVHTGKPTHLQRSVTREKELCMGHTEFYLPKDIQVEISCTDFMYSLSKKDREKKHT